MACEAAHKHALSCGNSRSVLSLSADAVILCTTSTIIEPLPGVAMIRIMLVDDHRLVRAGLRLVLQETADLEVIADACTGEESLALVRNQAPDVVFLDIILPGLGVFEATLRIVPRHDAIQEIRNTHGRANSW